MKRHGKRAVPVGAWPRVCPIGKVERIPLYSARLSSYSDRAGALALEKELLRCRGQVTGLSGRNSGNNASVRVAASRQRAPRPSHSQPMRRRSEDAFHPSEVSPQGSVESIWSSLVWRRAGRRTSTLAHVRWKYDGTDRTSKAGN